MAVYMSRNVSSVTALIAAIALATAAAMAFHFAPQVPLGVPWDEPRKVLQILSNTNEFNHPLLMLQIVRLANVWAAANDSVSILDLGRTMAALSGGLLVFAAIMLSRRIMEDFAALGVGVLTAVVPLTVLHSQLFKEDIFIAPWLILGLITLDNLQQRPTARSAALFGLVAGLAASAKYVGLILLPLCLLAPIWVKVSPSLYYRVAALAFGIAFIIFCVINFSVFLTPRPFLSELRFEIHQALTRHDIKLHGIYSNFAYTWNANLLPGLCIPLAFAGLLGASIVALRWRTSPPILRSLLVFGLTWYFMHELSPGKPTPGARQMTVMAAVFAVFAVVAARFIGCQCLPRSLSLPATAVIVAGLSVVPAMRSFELVRSAPNETRLVAERLVQDLGRSTAWSEDGFTDRGYSLLLDVRFESLKEMEQIADFLAVNELLAELYVFSLALPNQDQLTRRTAAKYEALLRRPALLITSKVGYFSFRNLPVRVIALHGDTHDLELAATRFASLPDIALHFMPKR
jgi:hypothetical protein